MMLPVDKKKDVSFYDPRGEMEAKRKKLLAENLISKGREEFQNETAGGMTVARSPWEFVGKAAQGAMGEYDLGKAEEQAATIEQNRQKAISEALSQWGSDPQAAAGILAQDPRTSEMAMKLMQGEIDYGRDQDRFNEEMQYKRDYMNMMGSRPAGGNTPAAIQVAEDMLAQEKMLYPERFQDPRYEAMRRYNLIGQAQKTYGFDRLTEYDLGYTPPTNQPPAGVNNTMPQPTEGMTDFQQYTQGFGQPSYTPAAPTTNDPLLASQQAIAQRQAEVGTNPYQRPELKSVSGADQVLAQREAIIEGAKSQAKTINEPMPANIVQMQDDLISKINTSQGLEYKMGDFIGKIDSGALDLGLMANLENMARNNMGMSTEQSRNLESFKATLENLRNESLRLNNGVQTDGDAQRAWNELVRNINDPQVVRQRLQEIANINNRGAQLQQQRLNQVRSEYRRGELNVPNIYEGMQQQGAAADWTEYFK